MSRGGPHKKVGNGLVALGSAAVLAVYTAGYVRTRTAADRLAMQSDARRPAISPRIVAVANVGDARPVAAPAFEPKRETVPPAKPEPAKLPAKDRPVAAAVAPADLEQPAPPPLEPLPAIEEKKPALVVLPPVPPPPPAPQWKDGTFYGWGTSRHGDIQAAVVIEAGRITSATIAQCLTRYSCSVIANLPPQVAQRQSPEVDYVSGATQSANAFYYAVSEALSKAK